MPVITPTNGGSSGGGGGPSTASAVVTTDPNTFVVSHDFDLGAVAAIYWKLTVTAVVADGETFATDPDIGPVGAEIAVDLQTVNVSRDGITWFLSTAANASNIWYRDQPADTHSRFEGTAITARYLRFVNMRIIDSSFSVYSGPNHPGATARIDLEYL